MLYTRVSSQQQEVDGTSLDTQRARCEAFAAERDYQVIGVFTDTYTGAVRTGLIRHLTRDNPDGELIEPPELPDGERNATEFFLAHLAAERPITGLVSLEVGRDTQEILEAGLIAARAGHETSLPLDDRAS